MTHTTPEQAKEIADMLEANRTSINQSLSINALRSLADQLEAVTAEQAVLVTRWKANEDVQEIVIKELTAERDAYKLNALRYRRLLNAAYSTGFLDRDVVLLVMNQKKLDNLISNEAIAKEAK